MTRKLEKRFLVFNDAQTLGPYCCHSHCLSHCFANVTAYSVVNCSLFTLSAFTLSVLTLLYVAAKVQARDMCVIFYTFFFMQHFLHLPFCLGFPFWVLHFPNVAKRFPREPKLSSQRYLWAR